MKRLKRTDARGAISQFLTCKSMRGEKDYQEKDLYSHRPVHEILSRPDFKGPFDMTLSNKQARELIVRSYPNFNFDGLEEYNIAGMAARCVRLAKETKKAVDLARAGKTQESLDLARDIKLIGDPNISIAETGIGSAIKATGGNLKMAVSFLGFKDLQNGVEWIEFIVRTWGFTPKEIVDLI